MLSEDEAKEIVYQSAERMETDPFSILAMRTQIFGAVSFPRFVLGFVVWLYGW